MDHCQLNVCRSVVRALAAAVLILAALTATAQTDPTPVSFTWTAPTTGAPAVQYIVEHSVNAGPWVQVATVTSNSYTLIAAVGDSHQIRVAGVDADGFQGPWSDPSEPYTALLLPGKPGQPILAE